MATVKNKKYAVVCTQEDVSVVRKMGVSEKAIFHITNYNQLLECMVAGDVLCVSSISSFVSSVDDFRTKISYLISNGIEFQSAYEKYLNFSLTHPITSATAEAIRVLVEREPNFMQMIWNSRLNIESKQTLIKRIGKEFLACLCVMFKSNGIKKRGN